MNSFRIVWEGTEHCRISPSRITESSATCARWPWWVSFRHGSHPGRPEIDKNDLTPFIFQSLRPPRNVPGVKQRRRHTTLGHISCLFRPENAVAHGFPHEGETNNRNRGANLEGNERERSRSSLIANTTVTRLGTAVAKDNDLSLVMDNSKPWPDWPGLCVSPRLDITKAVVDVYNAQFVGRRVSPVPHSSPY
jgi:hypothetical protein